MGRKTVGDIYLRRFKTSDIPKDEEGAQNFLMEVYKEKDELLGHYKESGGQKFTDDDVPILKVGLYKQLNHPFVKIKNIQIFQFILTLFISFQMPRKIGVLLNTVILNLAICTPLIYKLCRMILSGNNSEMMIAVVVILALYVIMKKFIDLTKISKASKYGEKKIN